MFNRSQYEQFVAVIKKDKVETILAILPSFSPGSALEKLKTALTNRAPSEGGNPKFTYGERVLGLAIKVGSFNAARFLVEVMQVPVTALELDWPILQAKFSSQPRFSKFRQIVAAGKTMPAVADKKNRELYCNNRVKAALENDDADELQYLAQVDRNLLLAYLEPYSVQDIFQQAAVKGALHCLQYLLVVFPEHRYKPDRDGNSLAQLAVRAGKKSIAEYLIDDVLYDLGADRNKQGDTVMDTARKQGHSELLTYLYQQYDPKTLALMPTGLGLPSFLDDEDLGVKGLTLMLHYYVKKNRNQALVFMVQDVNLNKGEKLAKLFDLFVRSSNENLLLYSDNGVHRYVYKCEKFEGKNYIFALDSSSDWTDKFSILAKMKQSYPDSLEKITFCMTPTRQQTADMGCHYYALKNASMLMKVPSFYEELSRAGLFLKPEQVADVTVFQFVLPARFMHLTTSPAKLAAYVKERPEEARKTVRKTKEGVPQNLMEYSLHSRSRFGMQTPELVANFDFDPEDEASQEEQFISKNNTLWYFRNKYLKYALPSLLEEFSEPELARLLSYYNAENLVLNENKSLCNKAISRQLTQWGKDRYLFIPRSTVKTSSAVKSELSGVSMRMFTQHSAPPKVKSEKTVEKNNACFLSEVEMPENIKKVRAGRGSSL